MVSIRGLQIIPHNLQILQESKQITDQIQKLHLLSHSRTIFEQYCFHMYREKIKGKEENKVKGDDIEFINIELRLKNII